MGLVHCLCSSPPRTACYKGEKELDFCIGLSREWRFLLVFKTSTLRARRSKKKKKMNKQVRDDSTFYVFVTQAMSLRLLLATVPDSTHS